MVGSYDAVVVHADNSALDFFERYGFTDDVVLNSRWRLLFTLHPYYQEMEVTYVCFLSLFSRSPDAFVYIHGTGKISPF